MHKSLLIIFVLPNELFQTFLPNKSFQIEFAVDDMFWEQPLDWHQYGFGEHRYHHHQHNSHHHHHHHHHHPVHHNPLPGDRLQQPACVPAAKGEESGSCLHLRARFVDMFLLTLIFIIILPLWICQQQLYDITSLSPSPLSSPPTPTSTYISS